LNLKPARAVVTFQHLLLGSWRRKKKKKKNDQGGGGN